MVMVCDADGDAILVIQARVLDAERMRAWRSRMTDEKAAQVSEDEYDYDDDLG